ncbi:uncharacterized protein LOC116295232 isoform X2 [Actinia tenebrosa]|uniref:Uncharacterized protein LOC116295232 isoform X2 n=1 Tax=Actinia tenebrosa TaxID=6105 RepID=A0A6P8HUD6_ACTTE|nr:uncharacterized protein LOC116295232 isoform X2 [Actinia tenebrosa]
MKIEDGACDLKFIKIGCFKDDQIEPRPLPELLFNDRDGSSGQEIDWKNWDKYVDDITCRCAKAAAKNRFGYFALQFYGECWSGQDAGASFPRAGRSSHCVSKGFEKCAERSRKNCVGESLSNFVYMMLAHESLCHVKYEKVGCYNNNRAFPILLFTDSNSNSPKYSNVSLDLSHWNSYIMDLTCRCAAKTKEHNYKYFSLQNFGGGKSSRPRARMKKKLCCGGLAGIDSSRKNLPDWMIAILIFLGVIALYMMYALTRWIYVKRLQGTLFRYRKEIDRSETSDVVSHV